MAKHGPSPLDEHRLDVRQEGVVVFAALPLLVLITMLSGDVRLIVLAMFAMFSAAVFCYHLAKWARRDKSDSVDTNNNNNDNNNNNNTDDSTALVVTGAPCAVTLINLVASRTVWRAVDAILIVVNIGLIIRAAFRIVRAERGQYQPLPSGSEAQTV